MRFWDEGKRHHIGSATLFRLEEYKLPEFKVTVETPRADGKAKAFLVGEQIEASVKAAYYFGGPVANANVELVVYQKPFRHWWRPPRQFPWFYKDLSQPTGYWYGQGQVVKRQTLKTNAEGEATFSLDSPHAANQDFEFRVEARVTDASRREVTGSGSVRVTRQLYYVYPNAKHNLYRPQDKVEISFKALDANDNPVQVEAMVNVTRDYWFEIWQDPDGREIKGDELKTLRQKSTIFPPALKRPGGRPWRQKFRGYQHDDILTRSLKTNAEGEAQFIFTPERQGYYRIAWTGKAKRGPPVKANTTVWVATNATSELGFRTGGVQIIVDQDTFRSGQNAPVMLSVPTNDRYVLFSIEGDGLYSYRLLHVTGTVKLIDIPIEAKHVPNIFLHAGMVSDGKFFLHTKQVVVPPLQHFLEVDVQLDRDQYQPREEGQLTVTTRGQDGKPVSAEVGLALVDESVYYIQQDYAQDPRQFFYGTKRRSMVRIKSTFHQKSYVTMIRRQDGRLIDQKHAAPESWALPADESSYKRDFNDADPEVRAALMSSRGGMHAVSTEFAASKAVNRVIGGAKAPSPSGQTAGKEPTVQVRSDFRSTVLWQPDVVTDQNGKAVVQVKFPDSLTTWRATARAVTKANRFGQATGTARTKKPLIVRLQAPRFFVVGDTVTVSANLNNNTEEAMTVNPSLKAEGVAVTGLLVDGNIVKGEPGPVEVKAHGEVRIDWVVNVQHPGMAKLLVKAVGSTHADAMQKSYPVYEHGIEKFVAKSGRVRGDDTTIKLDIPEARKPGSTELIVQITPSMAVTMLDALPYLIDYPYGCTEQTLSRFLPAVIVTQTLQDLGIAPAAVMRKMFGGIEPAHAAKTHSGGKNDLAKLSDMVQRGLDRLYDFQHDDGSWGWWKRSDSDHFMTAYVVWGLVLARQAGVDVKPQVIKRAVHYLNQALVEAEINYDLQAWMLHALSAHYMSSETRQIDPLQSTAFDNLWQNRARLNAYARALLTLSAHHFGWRDKAKVMIDNLANGVKIDQRPDISIIRRGEQKSDQAVMATAHWGEDGIFYRWSEGGVEATAFALRALLAIEPKHALIEPVMNWLIKNRRGAQWSNTRDTAITVLALNDYLKTSGEIAAGSELEYELAVNGHTIVTHKLAAEDVLGAPSRFAIDAKLIKNGINDIRIVRKSGAGPIYFSAQAKFFSLQEPVTPVGNEIFLRRQYYKLVGRPTLLKGQVYDRVPLDDGGTVTSGERIEAVLTIETKNNYEYLVIEDLKPAGLEAVAIRSGQPLQAREVKSAAILRKIGAGNKPSRVSREAVHPDASDYTQRTRSVYQELRDRKVALFIDKLPAGVWEITYDLRAEVPGTFHALPVTGHAMYVPEIRGNGEEIQVRVRDRKHRQ
ncbi:MAG: hypothetical protein O7G88_09800 [bacterium]|nr:hypothetical protein [bacterium]